MEGFDEIEPLSAEEIERMLDTLQEDPGRLPPLNVEQIMKASGPSMTEEMAGVLAAISSSSSWEIPIYISSSVIATLLTGTNPINAMVVFILQESIKAVIAIGLPPVPELVARQLVAHRQYLSHMMINHPERLNSMRLAFVQDFSAATGIKVINPKMN